MDSDKDVLSRSIIRNFSVSDLRVKVRTSKKPVKCSKIELHVYMYMSGFHTGFFSGGRETTAVENRGVRGSTPEFFWE